MKFKKFAAIALALSMTLSIFAGCDSKTSNKKDNKKTKIEKEEDEDEDEDEDDKSKDKDKDKDKDNNKNKKHDTEDEEPVIEVTEEIIDEDIDYEKDWTADVNDVDGKAFNLYQEYIKNNPDYKYAYLQYGDDADSDWALLVDEGDGVLKQYVMRNEKLVQATDWEYEATTISAEEILSFPVMYQIGYGAEADKVVLTDLKDGTYYGKITAINDDATKVFVTLEVPVIYTKDEMAKLQAGDVIKDVNGDPMTIPYSSGSLTVSDNFNGKDYGSLFDDEWYYFKELDDGTYLLVSDDDVALGTPIGATVIDVSNTVEVVDGFAAFYSEIVENVELDTNGANALADSFFFQSFTDDEYSALFFASYNGWVETTGILEPVVVENGKVQAITIGWR